VLGRSIRIASAIIVLLGVCGTMYLGGELGFGKAVR